MGKLRWYKRDPNAAIVGMRILSCEERGAYNTLLDLIYANDGNLVDDDRYLAGECALSLRSWCRIKKRLVGLGKIKIDDGKLHNGRADKEIEFGLKKVETARVAGEISARKKRVAPSKNNDIAPTAVATVVPTKSTPTITEKKNPEANASGAGEPDFFPRAELERELFRRGKAVLGKSAGGMIANLLRARDNDVALSRAVIELASTKQNPREYVAAAIKTGGSYANGAGRANCYATRSGAKTSADATLNAARSRADRIAERIEQERSGHAPADEDLHAAAKLSPEPC